ncbi:MAG: hypothetical protein L6R35_000704, partial [Caloplaca aegaea]
ATQVSPVSFWYEKSAMGKGRKEVVRTASTIYTRGQQTESPKDRVRITTGNDRVRSVPSSARPTRRGLSKIPQAALKFQEEFHVV